jgi:ComF family protein
VASPSIVSKTDSIQINRGWAGAIAASLFSVFFPSECRICGMPLTKISRLPVCQECLDAMRPTAEDVCSICGERLFLSYALDPSGESRCGLCRRAEPNFARAAAYGSYESGLRELIHLLKYGGVRPAANVLGRMLADAISNLEPELADFVVVVPVPLHRSKFRQREFNQAELIARAATKIQHPQDRLRLCPDVLVRKRETASQIGLSRRQRRENLRGAFAVAQPEAVKGHEVLVVDDVFTTGATVSECTRVLLRAGASKVWVATVARTLKISDQRLKIAGLDSDEMESSIEPESVPMAKAVGI